MVRFFFRIIYTLYFIKPIQLWYQLWYRLKNRFISIHWYDKNFSSSCEVFYSEVAKVLHVNAGEFLGNNTFNFLGIKHTFGHEIEWTYKLNGKLWNYNLQYFNYLLDESIPVSDRINLLKEFSNHLLKKSIQLEPYPVSLRIVNTLLFYSRHPFSDAIISEALKKQIRYLENNLEYHLLANHLLENSFSLFIASLFFEDRSLHKKAYTLLVKELNEQILLDGGHYECSPMYQSILLSKLLTSIDIAVKVKWVETTSVDLLKQKAKIMLGWINAYSFSDGSWALMNDAAEGVAPTTKSLNEAAQLLNIMPESCRLSTSGFRKIIGNNWEVLVKIGPVQPVYQPGHVHADIGSYCLWHKGQQIIVDPGVSTYTVSNRRNIERATFSHNTICFNGLSQSDVWSGFRVAKRAEVKCLEETDNYLEILIQPYFNKKIIHRRRFIKMEGRGLEISDFIQRPESANTVAKGKIQFACNIFPNYQEDSIIMKDVKIRVKGLADGMLKEGLYANSFNSLESGLSFEYTPLKESSFIFEFS